MFPVPESTDNSSELAGSPALQNRLDRFLEAFREDFRASLKVCVQTSLFRSNLVAGNYKRDQGDGYGKDWNQAITELHTFPPLMRCGKMQVQWRYTP